MKILLLLLSHASASLVLPRAPPLLSRRQFTSTSASVLVVAASSTALATAPPPPTDFDVLPEPTRPFIHYLTNADKLAANLEWYAEGVDSKEWRQVGAALDNQITAFSTTYGSRPGALISGGPQPGMSQLETAYGALAYHFSRYGDSSSEPLPEALKGTILRNVRDAKKGLKRAIAASESAAGA
jgi:hypothetical protein